MKKQQEEFPHSNFPYKLEYNDLDGKRTCYFQCEEHLKKHLERYKLPKKSYKISQKKES